MMSAGLIVPAVVILAGALLAVGSKNILHAVFGLAVSLVGVAGCFFVLGSPFVAIMEVLIYVGGISVTMLFAVMLSSVATPSESPGTRRKALSALAAIAFFAAGAVLIANTDFGRGRQLTASAHKLSHVGSELLGRFNLAFEALSIVLLLAIVGAIVIVRREAHLPAEDTE